MKENPIFLYSFLNDGLMLESSNFPIHDPNFIIAPTYVMQSSKISQKLMHVAFSVKSILKAIFTCNRKPYENCWLEPDIHAVTGFTKQ